MGSSLLLLFYISPQKSIVPCKKVKDSAMKSGFKKDLLEETVLWHPTGSFFYPKTSRT